MVSISSHSRRDHEERMPTYAPLAYKHFAMTRLIDLGDAFLMERARMATRSFCFMRCREVESAWLTGYSTPRLLKVPLVRIRATCGVHPAGINKKSLWVFGWC